MTGGHRILLIAGQAEERGQIRAALEAVPESAGWEVTEAADGEALNSLLDRHMDAQPFDLVLADLTFGGMTGREVLARVRRALPEALVVLLAGTEDSSRLQALAQDIAVPIVSKSPGALPRLTETIRAALELARRALPEPVALSSEASERFFRGSRMPILLLDPDSLAIRDTNRAACSFYGYSRAELVGRTLVSLTIEPRYGLQAAMAQAASAADATLVCRQRLVSGEERDAELTISSVGTEDQPLLFVVLHDVTERLLIERALHQSEERFRRIAENAPDMIFRWSYARGFEYVNPAATEMIGYTPEEHYADPGLGYRSILIEDLPIYESVFSDLADPEGPRRHCVIRWIHKQGHLVHVEMRMTPIFDEHGNLIAIEGIARDISQHVRARERLRELTTRLTQAHEEERRRLARELHDEIGQALTIARIRTRMIEKSLPDDADDLREKMSMLDTLIREMLQNVRSLSHELRPPLLDEMGWKPALEALCESFSQRTGLPVAFKGGETNPRFNPDVELVAYRVMQEALTNIARHAHASRAQINADLVDGDLRLTIEDNGNGFDLEAVTHAAGPDVGLGLLSMAERVDTVGGLIEIDAAPGRGTRIEIRLPHEEGQA